MSQETENFDSLRRLLTIKRHETPPPGYYDSFSHEVILRIKAGERGEDVHGYVWQMGWLQRIWSALEARPALAGALGLALCSVVVFGVISADTDNVHTVTGEVAQVHAVGMQVADNGADGSMTAQPLSVNLDDKSSLASPIAYRESQISLIDLAARPQATAASYQPAVSPNN
jgi:hypothetical protein